MTSTNEGKKPARELTYRDIQRLTPAELGEYDDDEGRIIDATLAREYDKTDLSVFLVTLFFALVAATVILFALIKFVKWAWFY